jgi:hypothetical protein
MTATKTFSTSQATEKIEFKIDDDLFHCRPSIPAGVIMRFGAMTASADAEDAADGNQGANAISAIREFFDAAITETDHAKFYALLDGKDRFVDLSLLIEIATWLADKYSARPTGLPSSTSSPGKTTGPDSTDGPLPGGTTYSRKETPVAVSV